MILYRDLLNRLCKAVENFLESDQHGSLEKVEAGIYSRHELGAAKDFFIKHRAEIFDAMDIARAAENLRAEVIALRKLRQGEEAKRTPKDTGYGNAPNSSAFDPIGKDAIMHDSSGQPYRIEVVSMTPGWLTYHATGGIFSMPAERVHNIRFLLPK